MNFKKTVLSLGLLCVSAVAAAQTINNAGVAKLEQATVAFLAQPSINPSSSTQFLNQHQFDVESVDWQQNGQIIHGPYHMIDGDEEADNVPYLFAYNQGQNMVGVGGWIKPALLKKLQNLPTVKCQQASKSDEDRDAIWICAHQSASKQTTAQFKQAFLSLAENAN